SMDFFGEFYVKALVFVVFKFFRKINPVRLELPGNIFIFYRVEVFENLADSFHFVLYLFIVLGKPSSSTDSIAFDAFFTSSLSFPDSPFPKLPRTKSSPFPLVFLAIVPFECESPVPSLNLQNLSVPKAWIIESIPWCPADAPPKRILMEPKGKSKSSWIIQISEGLTL